MSYAIDKNGRYHHDPTSSSHSGSNAYREGLQRELFEMSQASGIDTEQSVEPTTVMPHVPTCIVCVLHLVFGSILIVTDASIFVADVAQHWYDITVNVGGAIAGIMAIMAAISGFVSLLNSGKATTNVFFVIMNILIIVACCTVMIISPLNIWNITKERDYAQTCINIEGKEDINCQEIGTLVLVVSYVAVGVAVLETFVAIWSAVMGMIQTWCSSCSEICCSCCS